MADKGALFDFFKMCNELKYRVLYRLKILVKRIAYSLNENGLFSMREWPILFARMAYS